MKPPVRVAVTGAAGQIGYSLLFRIAAGNMLGADLLAQGQDEVRGGHGSDPSHREPVPCTPASVGSAVPNPTDVKGPP